MYSNKFALIFLMNQANDIQTYQGKQRWQNSDRGKLRQTTYRGKQLRQKTYRGKQPLKMRARRQLYGAQGV